MLSKLCWSADESKIFPTLRVQFYFLQEQQEWDQIPSQYSAWLNCVFISENKRPCLKFSQLSIKDSFKDLFNPQIEIFLIMYTRNNLNCPEPLLERNNSLNVNFNTSRKTVWLIHGYRPLGSIPAWLQGFLRSLLKHEDINIVVVDWNRGATTLIYDRAVKNTWKVAVYLSECIRKLLVSLECYVSYMLYNIQCVVQDYSVNKIMFFTLLMRNAFFS